MNIQSLVAQGGPTNLSIAEEISAAIKGLKFDRLDVAVAYATQSGLDALRTALGGWPDMTRWIIGLDDAITQPAAIDELQNLAGATVRFASLGKENRRFHPKAYCLWSSEDKLRCTLVIGSANMTLHGLRRNGEVGVILQAESVEETESLKQVWTSMNKLGDDKIDLDAYRALYEKARTARRHSKREAEPAPPPETDEISFEGSESFDGKPDTARIAWTEGASPSAGGRDLEFPRAEIPFFGLTGSPVQKSFRAPDGRVFDLTFTERQDNKMWRLLFSREAIASTIGRLTLRPVSGVNRSDLAIIFEKTTGDADYELMMVEIGSLEHSYLMERSEAAGGLGRTRDPGGRHYGYF